MRLKPPKSNNNGPGIFQSASPINSTSPIGPIGPIDRNAGVHSAANVACDSGPDSQPQPAAGNPTPKTIRLSSPRCRRDSFPMRCQSHLNCRMVRRSLESHGVHLAGGPGPGDHSKTNLTVPPVPRLWGPGRGRRIGIPSLPRRVLRAPGSAFVT